MNTVIDPRRQKLGLVAITAFNVVHATILANQLAKRNPGQPGKSRFHTVCRVYATLDRRAVTGVRAVGDVALTGDIGTITSHGT